MDHKKAWELHKAFVASRLRIIGGTHMHMIKEEMGEEALRLSKRTVGSFKAILNNIERIEGQIDE